MRKLILLVDDDSSLSDCLSEVVQMEGVDVVCLPNGEEALHWLHHSDRLPSLILADLRMPVMDGARFLEEKDKCVPLIFFTASDVSQRSLDRHGYPCVVINKKDHRDLMQITANFLSTP